MSQTSALTRLRPWVLLAIVAGLSSCGGDDYCRNCYVSPPNYPPYQVSYGLVAGNFTGNGFTSIVETNTVKSGYAPYPGNLKAYLSTGADAYATPLLTSAGDNPLYLASASIYGDALPDIVSASFEDGTLSVFFNQVANPGTFNAPLVLSSPGASQVAIGDMTGNGMLDLISADYNVSLFLQTSPGTFASPIALYPGGANWVAVGDLNDDGSPDVALTDGTGVELLFHTGVPAATTYAAPFNVYPEPSTSISGANLIAISDLTNNGLNDLVITDPGPPGGATPTVQVLLQDPANHGGFLAPVSYPTVAGSQAQSIVVIDVNGDGLPDIVIGGTSAVSVLLQDATAPGTFLPATNYPVTNANQIAVADANGDGLVDIIVATAPTQPTVGGVITNQPGVLLQIAGAPGTFSAVQNLTNASLPLPN
jgi:hypothetical protein